jgi:DNA invertase Pin-like site-specific DNA recombinase
MSSSIAAARMTSRGDVLLWILAGALGGLVTLLAAAAVEKAHHRRERVLPGPTATHPGLDTATEPAPRPRSARVKRPTTVDDRTSNSVTAVARDRAGGRRPSGLPAGSVVLGYVTVGAVSRASEEGESLASIETRCESSGWKLLEIVRDRDEGPTLDRPGLGYALERVASGQARALVVSDLERLTRSIIDLGALMEWFRDADATLIALDLDIDTSTPEGEHVASTLIALSTRERARIASGTRRGLASGHAAGRPAVSQVPELAERIAAMREANMTLRAIADALNAEGVPTLRGGKKWRPSSIQAVLGYRRPTARDHLPPPRS